MKEGWKKVRLGDVGTFQRGGGFLKRDYVDSGYPCLHYGQIHMKLGLVTHKHLTCISEELAKTAKRATKGDLIIAITSEDVEGSCKCTAWMGNYDIAVGSHTAIFRHTLNPLFVAYYFSSPYFQKQKEIYTHGFKVIEIKPSDISQISIPIPPSSEQQRIVSILDQAFEKIDALKANAEKNLANAKALFQQSIKEEFQLRAGWSLRKLGELGSFKNGMNFAHNESGFDLHLLGVGDFKDYFSIEDTSNLQLLSLNQQPSEEYLLQNEDIVFVRSNGNKQLVGRSVVVYPDNTPTTFSGFCIRFRKSIDNLDIRYLVSFLKQPDTRKKLVGNGANISNLNQRVLNDLEVPLPPQKEQKAIADKIYQLTTLYGKMQLNYQQTITECDALKQAILRQAFSGEL